MEVAGRAALPVPRGAAGSSSILAALADLTDRPGLTRVGRITAGGGAILSVVALVDDLGRPERFLHMLRVFKPTSPLSVGAYILWPFGAAAAVEILGWFPRLKGILGEPFHEGRPGTFMRAAKACTAAGAGLTVLARRTRWGAVASGTLLAAGSLLTRFGGFDAGMASARNPKYTGDPAARAHGRARRTATTRPEAVLNPRRVLRPDGSTAAAAMCAPSPPILTPVIAHGWAETGTGRRGARG